MPKDKENEYLLKAIEAFKRRMIVVSPDFEILAAHCPLDDFQSDEIVGKTCHEILYNRGTPCEFCAVKESKSTGKPALRPKTDSAADLETMPCFYAYPIFEEGKIEALVSLDFDLPTRGEIERKLQRSNALLRNLILSSVDGVIAADKTGNILIYNDTAAEVFGYSVEEALNELSIRDIYPDEKEHEVMEVLRSEEYGGPGKLRAYQVEVVHKSGERIPISLNAAIVYENNTEVATIGFFHDMREIMRMKDELEKTQVQLLQAEKMASLGKLAAGVAHQLNNPLAGITLFTKLVLEEYELEDAAREDLCRVVNDAQRCRDTVKELLEFTRQTRYFMQPHDVNRAVDRTMFLLENQTLFQNISIEKNLAESLPTVYCDIQQMNHLLMNIILNAAQAMEGKGTLTLTTKHVPDEDRARIEISDTGPGIDEEILPRIFEPFYTTKEEGEGTGLGLSLVYGIVENHGGNIKAVNNADKGSTFIVNLPLTRNSSGGNTFES